MDKSHMKPQEAARVQQKVKKARKNQKLGKLAALLDAAVRLKGRPMSSRELKRQAVKAQKKQQKRMELLTKSKYQASKQKPRPVQMAKDKQKVIDMLRLQNHALTKRIADLKSQVAA